MSEAKETILAIVSVILSMTGIVLLMSDCAAAKVFVIAKTIGFVLFFTGSVLLKRIADKEGI